jgi:hypothetical protein
VSDSRIGRQARGLRALATASSTHASIVMVAQRLAVQSPNDAPVQRDNNHRSDVRHCAQNRGGLLPEHLDVRE